MMQKSPSRPSQTAWHFEGCLQPLLTPADPELFDALQGCLKGWRATPGPSVPREQAIAAAQEAGRGRWKVASQYTDRPTGSLPVAAAVCTLIADLSLARLEASPELLGLHAAAVSLQGQAFVLTGPARAGKSTFATRLALEPDAAFICDDVLAITPEDDALSFGIAPRLRLPLPEASDLHPLLEVPDLLRDTRYAYPTLPRALGYGARQPIAAILSYERRPDLPPGLYALPEEDALSLLMRQTLSRFDTASDALDRLTALAARVPRARLICGDIDQGLALLRQWQESGLSPALPEASVPASVAVDEAPHVLPDAEQVFSRLPDVQLRRTGDRAWLWHPEDGQVWELNATAHAVWQMLELSGSAVDLAEALAEIYPTASPDEVMADLRLCLGQLATAGFVEPDEMGAD